jgi:hypothetical protein
MGARALVPSDMNNGGSLAASAAGMTSATVMMTAAAKMVPKPFGL